MQGAARPKWGFVKACIEGNKFSAGTKMEKETWRRSRPIKTATYNLTIYSSHGVSHGLNSFKLN